MKEKIVKLDRLWKKGYKVSVRVSDIPTWKNIIKTDPTIPRSFLQLRRLGKAIVDIRKRQSFDPHISEKFFMRGIINHRFEECGESLYYKFFAGLKNPSLTAAQRAIIEADMDADMPTFENNIETDHFILRWTNSSTNTNDNIADDNIINETSDYLETAWQRYNTVFGKAPYVPASSSKIEIVFYYLGPTTNGQTLPENPIDFNAERWLNNSGIRQPVSSHELFHRVQYAFGYRTKTKPDGTPYDTGGWFSEGTASWAEVFVWQRVSRASKVTDLFSNPDLNLYDASYSSMPFWVFFQTRQQDTPDDNPIVDFLQKYDSTGKLKDSLAEVIDEDWPTNNVYGQLDNFYALFSRERRIGAWRQTPWGGQPYATILDPNDNNIVPNLTVTEVSLGTGDSYINNTGSVSQFGSDYYRFKFGNDTDGQTFTISVTGVPDGDYSYYLVWEKNVAFKKAVFPSGATGNYTFSEEIELNTADSLMLIISGRGKGGAYTINASMG